MKTEQVRNETGRKKYRLGNYKSKLARRIVFQYALVFVVFIVIYVLLIIFFSYLYYRNSFQRDSIIYRFAQIVKAFYPFSFAFPIVPGWLGITFFFLSKPLRYLDEVVLSSEKLAMQNNEPVILSDELKDVQDELNLVREQSYQNAMLAKEAEQRKNDLIVYLAHDLKTPLASVIGYLNLLRDEKDISEESREKYISISLEKAQRLEDLINEFFEIARFNLSNITLQYSTINLSRLLEQLVYEFKPMLKEKRLDCNLQMPENVMLSCDADKIQRVFDNLLRNAVIYSFEDSEILITVTKKEEELLIRFDNYGKTIPKEKLERIFEQFYRLDAARGTSSGGAGLGLAIAKEIVELHKGKIRAESEGGLITFQVTLPTGLNS